jgi:hypothetical protein
LLVYGSWKCWIKWVRCGGNNCGGTIRKGARTRPHESTRRIAFSSHSAGANYLVVCYFCRYARNEKYVNSGAKMSSAAGPYTLLIGNDISPIMPRMIRITPAVTAPGAVQRAFDIVVFVSWSRLGTYLIFSPRLPELRHQTDLTQERCDIPIVSFSLDLSILHLGNRTTPHRKALPGWWNPWTQ